MVSPGEHVGDYEIEKELGAGGMARVYKARHSFLETVHALKILDPKYRTNAEVRKRFLDEAKLQAKHLIHPNIVKVTNIVATRDVAALVMEFIDGSSLEHFILELGAPPPPDLVRQLMLPVLSAVAHAHAGGVVHRDIKPANILLQKNQDGSYTPKVTDFGIAKVMEGEGSAGTGKKSTHADARMGTLAYMSPEQIRRAKSVTARSDIFSLGAMLYELCTRHTAFDGDSDFDVMDKIVRGVFEPPERRVAGLDPVLAACISKALSPDPALRFQSCDEFARALKGEIPVTRVKKATTDPTRSAAIPAAIAAGGSGSVAALSSPGQTGGGRRWLPLILILAAVGAGGAATAIALSKRKSSAPSPSPTIVDTSTAPASPSQDPSPSETPGTGRGDLTDNDLGTLPFPTDPGSPAPTEEPSPTGDPSPLPPPASCAGTYASSGLRLDLTDDVPGCGSYTIIETESKARCSGRLSRCTRSGDDLSMPFGCKYGGELKGMPLSGTFKTTCGPDTLTVTGMGRRFVLQRQP